MKKRGMELMRNEKGIKGEQSTEDRERPLMNEKRTTEKKNVPCNGPRNVLLTLRKVATLPAWLLR